MPIDTKKLREARIIAGLTQGEVAEQLDVHQSTISRIESGRRKIQGAELLELLDIYGIALDDVVT